MMFHKRLSEQLRADVQRYIDAHYMPTDLPIFCARFASENVRDAAPAAQKAKRPGPRRQKEAFDAASFGEICAAEEAMPAPVPGEAAALPDLQGVRLTLELDEPFSVKLLKLIDQKGMDDVACYKKAHVSRQTWYKILNEKDYKPNKKTVLSFAVALELTLEETQTLLASVGFVLSQSSLFDVILMYCLSHEIYSIETIDEILFGYDQETLYSKA